MCRTRQPGQARCTSLLAAPRARAQVGIIPTDTFPAIVVDVQNRDAVLKLYAVKELNPKRPLSILCGCVCVHGASTHAASRSWHAGRRGAQGGSGRTLPRAATWSLARTHACTRARHASGTLGGMVACL